jgi:glycosyltransferase involved in cell wall biosynthesis
LLIGERTSKKQESVEFEQRIHCDFAASGLANQLHMLGYRNDVDRILGEIDLLIHPAHQEPFGRVLLEASACGVPIVATNVGGTSEIIVDGETGILIPPGDPTALANAAIELLTNRNRSRQLGENARRRAEECFSIENAATNLAAVWKSVIESR